MLSTFMPMGDDRKCPEHLVLAAVGGADLSRMNLAADARTLFPDLSLLWNPCSGLSYGLYLDEFWLGSKVLQCCVLVCGLPVGGVRWLRVCSG